MTLGELIVWAHTMNQEYGPEVETAVVFARNGVPLTQEELDDLDTDDHWIAIQRPDGMFVYNVGD